MATIPAASPSSPSMKLTALVVASTTKTVTATSTGPGSTVLVPKKGTDSRTTPL